MRRWKRSWLTEIWTTTPCWANRFQRGLSATTSSPSCSDRDAARALAPSSAPSSGMVEVAVGVDVITARGMVGSPRSSAPDAAGPVVVVVVVVKQVVSRQAHRRGGRTVHGRADRHVRGQLSSRVGGGARGAEHAVGKQRLQVLAAKPQAVGGGPAPEQIPGARTGRRAVVVHVQAVLRGEPARGLPTGSRGDGAVPDEPHATPPRRRRTGRRPERSRGGRSQAPSVPP